jgi:hypothetical protein
MCNDTIISDNNIITIYNKSMPSFKKHHITKYHGAKAVPHIYKHDTSVFLVLTKSQNGNVVVMRANLYKDGTFKKIDAFWLDLDPKYRTDKKHDRVEFTSMDAWAYGVTVHKKVSSREWIIVFNQLNTRKLRIIVDSNKNVKCWSSNKTTHIYRLHINIQSHMFKIPKVVSIEMYGCKDHKKICKVIKT